MSEAIHLIAHALSQVVADAVVKLQVPPAAHAASSSFSRAVLRIGRAMAGAFTVVGSFTGEGFARIGNQTSRFARWVRRPDVTEQLEMYLGLAVVVLAGHFSLRKLRCASPPLPLALALYYLYRPVWWRLLVVGPEEGRAHAGQRGSELVALFGSSSMRTCCFGYCPGWFLKVLWRWHIPVASS